MNCAQGSISAGAGMRCGHLELRLYVQTGLGEFHPSRSLNDLVLLSSASPEPHAGRDAKHPLSKRSTELRTEWNSCARFERRRLKGKVVSKVFSLIISQLGHLHHRLSQSRP